MWLITGTVYLMLLSWHLLLIHLKTDLIGSGGNQDVKYDYTAELTGAGSRSEFYTKLKVKLLYIKFDYYDTGIEAVYSLRPWNIIDLT